MCQIAAQNYPIVPSNGVREQMTSEQQAIEGSEASRVVISRAAALDASINWNASRREILGRLHVANPRRSHA